MNPFIALCIGRVGCCVGSMAFAGALPVIRDEWHLDAASAGSVQMVFNISNAIALLAASWLSDHIGPRKVYLICSWLGVIALAIFACFASNLLSALVLMAFVGLTQGGTYTPALMLAISMHGPAKRGYAVGTMLAAGSLGYLLSIFISTWGALRWGVSIAFLLCTVVVLSGAILGTYALKTKQDNAMTARHVPHLKPPRKRINVMAILLLTGYMAHCWELLGNWAWTPTLVATALTPWQLSPVTIGLLTAATIHLSGMISTFTIGSISDRFNRTIVLIIMGGMGALCSLLIGWSASLSASWVLFMAMVGSFFILGDSGVLSAAIADNVAPETLGRVMGIRSLLGFGIGSFSPFIVGIVLDETSSWKLAYSVLAMGGGIAFLAAIAIPILSTRLQR